MPFTPDPLVYVQYPDNTGDKIMKVIQEALKDEEHFEESLHGHVSFRAELLRNLLNKINGE